MKDAFYISRYLYGVNIFNEQTKEKLKLTDILNKNIVDINVIIGNKEQLKCRLVAVKIPEEIANERRRKAKQNRDKRVNYSTEYYHALGWVIYITNIEREVYGYKEIMAAYRSRWQIEIIFKTWKSNFNIENLIPEKPKANKSTPDDLKKYNHRVETIIYMMLIFIVLFQLQIYLYFVYRVLEKHQKFISLLKLTKFVALNIERILVSKNLDEFENEIAYYATHEKRKNDKICSKYTYCMIVMNIKLTPMRSKFRTGSTALLGVAKFLSTNILSLVVQVKLTQMR